MQKRSYYIITGITLYRVIAAPFLLALVFTKQYDVFKWLLGVSFFTDFIDGYLARKYKVTSVFGSRLDSIGDDLTVIAAIVGLFVFKPEFIKEELIMIIALGVLYVIQTSLSFFRYGKITSFHTYTAKVAAILQGIFLLLVFFTPEPNKILFYIATVATALDLIEEITLVIVFKKWKANVKGLYWVIKDRERKNRH